MYFKTVIYCNTVALVLLVFPRNAGGGEMFPVVGLAPTHSDHELIP